MDPPDSRISPAVIAGGSPVSLQLVRVLAPELPLWGMCPPSELYLAQWLSSTQKLWAGASGEAETCRDRTPVEMGKESNCSNPW